MLDRTFTNPKRDLPILRNGKPIKKFSGNPKEWKTFANKLRTTKKKNWKLVVAPGYKHNQKIHAGDILIHQGKKGPGHVMIAIDIPKKIKGQLGVEIADSTSMPKYHDKRSWYNQKTKKKATGMGTGVIHLRNVKNVLQMEKHKNAKEWKDLYVIRPVSK